MEKKNVRNDNFVTILGWQINELGLKGNELIVYACIHGFSQGGQSFRGSLQYLADWTNSTKRGIQKTLKKLVEKGMLSKKEKIINGVKFCEYRTVTPWGMEQSSTGVWNKVHGGMEQSSMGVRNKVHGGMEQSSTNNIEDNIRDNIEDKVDYSLIVSMYNDICMSFPRCRTLSEARKKAIKARMKTYSIDDFKEMFQKAENSRFLRGGNERNWTANFDWMMKDANFAKILDGNYNNKEKEQRKKAEMHDLDDIF